MARVIGRIEEFEDRSCTIVEVGGRSIGIYRRGGNLFAIKNVCPHKGGPLCRGPIGGTMVPSGPDSYMYTEDVPVVRCPWHGWEFDITTGEGLYGAAPLRVATYNVRVEGGEVVLDVKG